MEIIGKTGKMEKIGTPHVGEMIVPHDNY